MPVFSTERRYSTASRLGLRQGACSRAVGVEESKPNSDGTKRLTPALTAASTMESWLARLVVAVAQITISWPRKAMMSDFSV